MEGQHLDLKGAVQPLPGHPHSSPEQKQFFTLLWVNISPGNQINRKKLLIPGVPHSLNRPKFYWSLEIPSSYLILGGWEWITDGQVHPREKDQYPEKPISPKEGEKPTGTALRKNLFQKERFIWK